MKYLNFEGLQYFYSKLSSSLASQYVSQGNLKTINGQSLIGTGDITIEGGTSGDYLPLSGGTLTGSLYMTGGRQLQLIGIGGALSFKDVENNTLAGIYTFNDHSPVNDKSYGIIYCKTDDNSSEGRLQPHNLTLTTGGESIYVSSSGIEKNGGSPTEVFATDGSIADLSTVGDGKYLPLNGGGSIKINDNQLIKIQYGYIGITNNLTKRSSNFSDSQITFSSTDTNKRVVMSLNQDDVDEYATNISQEELNEVLV